MECHPGCARCGNNLPFKMPKEIFDAALKEKLVIFAGAGTSTEAKGVFKSTFYEDICNELNIAPDSQRNPFPKVMTKFCEKFGKNQLIERILKRFQYVQSFSELYYHATEFHQELSTISQIKLIFTTNWDNYFESECGAIPYVISEDFAFWNLPERKVFKIHGSISNIGTIIVTEEDYKKVTCN